MADRTLVEYLEQRLDYGPYWRLKVDRSSAGQPGLLFTISFDSVDGTLKHEEMTIVVDDGWAVINPIIEWLEKR